MLKTRQQIMDRLDAVDLPRQIRRAIEAGNVELLGGFDTPSRGRELMVKVISPISGKDYYLSIQEKMVWLTIAPNWNNWLGEDSDNSIIQGDNPQVYKILKKKVFDKEGLAP